ncbi:hypothetical protein [Viscerimonas tarda]
MKKINFFLLAVLLLCQSGFTSLMAQPSVTTPVQGQDYSIVQATGLFLTRNLNTENPQIKNPSGNWDQVFVFEPVAQEDGTFYIKNAYDDDYLVRGDANAWTMVWVKDPTTISTPANGKYQIVAIDGNTDYIQIKNLGSGFMIGTDDTADGSTVYGDKSGLTDVKYLWKIKEYSNEVDLTALRNKFNEAKSLFDTTSEGSGSDQYPSSTRNALKDAIDDAQDIIDDSSAEQFEVNDALLTLTDALLAYINSVNPYRPDASITYYIIHSSGLFFGTGVNIGAGSYAPDQQFKFIAVAGKDAVYNIQLVSTGAYLARSGGWSLVWGDDPSDGLAQFQIKSTGTGYYRIWCTTVAGDKTAEQSYMGTDSNDSGAGVYVDKSGQDGKHYWKFQDVDNMPVIKTALEEAIDKVTEFLSYASKGDGSDQYPAAQYDALTAAKGDAEAIFGNEAATQAQVGDATLALNDALAAAIAAVNPFLPDVTKTYNIIHFGGLFFGEVDQNLEIFTQSKQDNQLFKFVAVAGKTGVYNIQVASVPGKYVTRSAEPHLDGAGLHEEGKYDDYKLFWGEDATTDFAQFEIRKVGNKDYHTIKCITPGPQRPNSYIGTDNTTENSGASVDKDGKNTNHYWRVVDSSETGISRVVDKNDVIVYANGNQLQISELKGQNRISVYTLTGQSISASTVNGSTYSKELTSGNYIVVVNGTSSYRGIIIVK